MYISNALNFAETKNGNNWVDFILHAVFFGSCIKCDVHNNLVLNHKRTCSGGTESFQNNTCILGKFTMLVRLMKMIHCPKAAVNPLYMADNDMDETREHGESQMKHIKRSC